ncbi:unnamed protein product [Fraxinus pennsylvanica]|uniref:Uncharacterized protein n=1 Tax=Fraxinus pennsylvanica TaxID=56036 RepID=A0AAD1ZSE4_9LAMI|nr:unnamed protein product [Fraxinus pennsylvanica]
MDENSNRKLQSDWYSRTRLHNNPVEYDFPGDRFIPDRSLMDLDQAHSLLTTPTQKPSKPKFKRESCISDAPNIVNHFYLNIMDWGKANFLAIALGSKLYLWNADNRKTELLSEVGNGDDYPTGVAWLEDAQTVAAGYQCSKIYLWDAETLKIVRCLTGHQNRVGSVAWNGQILTSESSDNAIMNHDHFSLL